VWRFPPKAYKGTQKDGVQKCHEKIIESFQLEKTLKIFESNR